MAKRNSRELKKESAMSNPMAGLMRYGLRIAAAFGATVVAAGAAWAGAIPFG